MLLERHGGSGGNGISNGSSNAAATTVAAATKTMAATAIAGHRPQSTNSGNKKMTVAVTQKWNTTTCQGG